MLYVAIVCVLFVAGCGETTDTVSSSGSDTETTEAAGEKKLSSKEKVKAALDNTDGTVEDPRHQEGGIR